nr:hypothetical protein [Tanacetum cinerariifolium]
MLGKEQDPQDLGRPAFDAALRETPSRRMGLEKRLRSRHARGMSESPEPRHGHSESPRKRDLKRKTVFKRLEKGVFHRLRDKGKSTSTYSNDSRRRSYRSSRRDTESCYQSSRSRETEFSFEKHHKKSASSQRTKALLKCEGSIARELPPAEKCIKYQLKFTISSKERGNPQRSSCGGEEDGTEGLMIIEAEIRGHFVHRMYVDRGSSLEILGEIIWPLGQILLLEKIDDEKHSTSAWMNFMIVRSPSPYNGIIGRPRVKRFQAVPSIAHGMLKFLMTGETVTLRSSMIILLECMMFSGPGAQQPVIDQKCTKKSDFQWTAEAEMAFKQMKILIEELPMLTAPEEKEELVIYPVATKESINAVLMTERDGKQMLIYFVNRALQGPKINYTQMEKLILALVAERLLKWRFELEEHNSHYRPRTSVKGQTLANFIVERPEDDPPDTPMEDKEELLDPNEALIASLQIAEQIGIKNIQVNVDSRLVANQVNGTYVAKEPSMIKYLEKADYVLRQIYERPSSIRQFKIRGCKSFKIRNPQANSLVEREKRSLGKEIKARLDKRSKNWMEDISHVLWAHRTMIKSSNEETPFSLTYGTKTVILVEIGMPTLRTVKVDMIKNNEALEINLDLLEEKRDHAAIHEAKSKAMMENTIMTGFATQVSSQETSSI